MRVVRATESPGPLIEFVGAIGIAGMFLYLAGRFQPGRDSHAFHRPSAHYAPSKTSPASTAR